MNDLYVPWKKLTRRLPRAKNYADDKVPRFDEIKKIIASTYPLIMNRAAEKNSYLVELARHAAENTNVSTFRNLHYAMSYLLLTVHHLEMLRTDRGTYLYPKFLL